VSTAWRGDIGIRTALETEIVKVLVHGLIEPFEPLRTGNDTVVVASTAVESLGVDGLEGRAKAGAGVVVCS
jgi:hypothetical protein